MFGRKLCFRGLVGFMAPPETLLVGAQGKGSQDICPYQVRNPYPLNIDYL